MPAAALIEGVAQVHAQDALDRDDQARSGEPRPVLFRRTVFCRRAGRGAVGTGHVGSILCRSAIGSARCTVCRAAMRQGDGQRDGQQQCAMRRCEAAHERTSG
ncbi:hypothetical protein D3C86_1643280 [compost metagenome]